MNLYSHLKWLNAFAVINEIAMQKILKKFVKTHFNLKDNVVDKGLLLYIQNKQMIHRENLHYLIHDIKLFYAEFFTEGNLKDAVKSLE